MYFYQVLNVEDRPSLSLNQRELRIERAEISGNHAVLYEGILLYEPSSMEPAARVNEVLLEALRTRQRSEHQVQRGRGLDNFLEARTLQC